MTSKKDISKILSKGLTGKEAGKLVLEDNWLVDHMREGFLSPKDLSAIKAGLKSTRDIEDYNSYIETYRIIDYTLKDAHIMALQFQVRMENLIRLITMYLFGSTDQHIMTKPVIMTEKEYQDTKARQKKELSEDIHELETVILWRYWETTPEGIREQEPDDEYALDWLSREYPELYQGLISEIIELIKAGKLQPVSINGKDKQKIISIETKWQDLSSKIRSKIPDLSADELINRIGKYTDPEDRISEDVDKEIHEVVKDREKLLKSLYKANKGKDNSKELIRLLEKLLDKSISQEEKGQLLEYTYCSGEDLYKTGLPEWIKWIDEFKADYDVNDGGIAILVDPKSYQVDERGYYIKSQLMKRLTEGLEKESLDFRQGITNAKEEIKVVLSFHSIMELISEVIGIDFAEDTRSWIKDILNKLWEYERLRSNIMFQDDIPDIFKDSLSPISLKKLKPSAGTIKYLRERVAMSLGDEWWGDVKSIMLEDLRQKEVQDG
jgi:hypothetical protein